MIKAPKTFLAAIDAPLADEKMGLGMVLSHDQIGVTNQTDINFSYAYHLQLGDGKLSLGLKAGVSNYSYNTEDLTVWDDNDNILMEDQQSSLIPKFGTGIYYASERWFAGFSIPTLWAYEDGNNFSVDINKASFLRKHFLLNGGYIFDLNDKLKLKPSVLVKYVKEAPVEADINVSVLYAETIWFGISYRTNDAVIALIEYQANKNFRVGYAYDYTLTDLGDYSSGTHEIMIGYDFGKGLTEKSARLF